MMVELITNPDIYEDVYPESEDEAGESEDDESESDSDTEDTKALAAEKKRNDDSMIEANEEREAAAGRLAMLENYGRSFEKDRPSDLESCISAYREERKKAFLIDKGGQDKIVILEKERVKILERQAKDFKVNRKRKEKASKEKWKTLEKKQKLIEEKSTAKRRLKEERVQFWPRKVYRVTLSLDTNSELTPASSRRGSADSLANSRLESSSSEACDISLSVSYITHSAYWSPTYDLSLNTVTSSGLIVYRAEFCNTTSETWRDSQVCTFPVYFFFSSKRIYTFLTLTPFKGDLPRKSDYGSQLLRVNIICNLWLFTFSSEQKRYHTLQNCLVVWAKIAIPSLLLQLDPFLQQAILTLNSA